MTVHTLSQKYIQETKPELLEFIDSCINESFEEGSGGNFRFDETDEEVTLFNFSWLSCTVVDDKTVIIDFAMNVEDVSFTLVYTC